MWERSRWDPNKARQNLAKHGVSFFDAESVLGDPLRVVRRDVHHSVYEERFQAIGMSHSGSLLVVVLTIETGGIIRLISARRPTRRERHAYEDNP